jgi:hypothetical protein
MSNDVKEICFFLPKKTLNEATVYYVDVVKDAFDAAGYSVLVAEEFKELKNQNVIFVMSAKWCFLVKILYPKVKVVTWFQGVGAEEILLNKSSYIGKYLWRAVEWFSMKYSFFNFYVSEKMRRHFIDMYKVEDSHFFIMPCFNKTLNLNSFEYEDNYKKNSFVYAGSLDKWQCIEQILAIYKGVENQLQDTSLTLLTKDYNAAEILLKKHGIKNYNINFVKLDDLDKVLEKFKYGFLIREDHIINNVSTPTKMNSYLANGIIPIYTDSIDSFNSNFVNYNFLCLDSKACVDISVNNIVSFNEALDDEKIDLIQRDISSVFNKYYSRNYYVTEISKIFKDLDLG